MIERQLAHQILMSLEKNPAQFLSDLLSTTIDTHQVPVRESRLLSQLVYGVTRYKRRLEAILRSQLSKPNKTLDSDLKLLLLTGLYQLIMLDRIPPYAAINDAVKLAKRLDKSTRGAGFVNGVLRNISRQPKDLFAAAYLQKNLASKDKQSPFSALWHSVDDQFYRKLKVDFPDNVDNILSSLNQPAGLHIRTNITQIERNKLADELLESGVETTLGQHASTCLYAAQNTLGNLLASKEYKNGACRIQDESSQLVAPMLIHALTGGVQYQKDQQRLRVLDLCAGRGGKATHIAELAASIMSIDNAPSIDLYCYDIAQSKLEVLSQEMKRLKLRPPTLLTDPTHSAPYDAILVDAPCTGTGVIRRHPESKWTWSNNNLRKLVNQQRELLDLSYRLLRFGGTIVYAVCSILKNEGQGQINHFLKQYVDCALVPPTLPLRLKKKDNWLTILPHEHDMDGFFAAIVTKSRT